MENHLLCRYVRKGDILCLIFCKVFVSEMRECTETVYVYITADREHCFDLPGLKPDRSKCVHCFEHCCDLSALKPDMVEMYFHCLQFCTQTCAFAFSWCLVFTFCPTVVFVVSCIFILLSRESGHSAIRARLGVASHLFTTPKWGNFAKCLSQRHNK